MRDRLIELLYESEPLHERDLDDDLADGEIEAIADHLLANGVIVPPCKVGDTVYTNINGTGLHNSFRVESVDLLGFSNGLYSWTWHQLGKSVFLTLEQAEKALAERSKSDE